MQEELPLYEIGKMEDIVNNAVNSFFDGMCISPFLFFFVPLFPASLRKKTKEFHENLVNTEYGKKGEILGKVAGFAIGVGLTYLAQLYFRDVF